MIETSIHQAVSAAAIKGMDAARASALRVLSAM